MKRTNHYRLLRAALALVFLFSSLTVLRQLQQDHAAQMAYEDAVRTAFDRQPDDPATELPDPEIPRSEAPELADPIPEPLPEPEPAPQPEPEPEPEPAPLPDEVQFLRDLDLAAMQAVNPDVIGWLHIPDTVISYPLLRSHDNREYLDLTWDRQTSRAGSIFLEQRSSPDLSDFHTLIYGHNNKDGKMFSDLLDYGSQSFADAHPTVWIALEDRILQLSVYSSYMADVVSDTYRLVFENGARRQSAIDYYRSRSLIQTDITPLITDRLVTLSTCSGQGNYDIRWVVHTVVTGELSPE